MKYDMKQYNRINNRPITRKRINESYADNEKFEWCHLVSRHLNIDKATAEYLYKLYITDNDIFFDVETYDGFWCCTPCEALLMLAWMLLDDCLDKDMYIYLGLKKYKTEYHGMNNPFFYSWFDEGNTLEIIKKWISNNPVHWNKIYNIVKNNDGITDDTIWGIHELFE